MSLPQLDLAAAVTHLATDPRLERLIARVGPPSFEVEELQSPFESLMEAIAYQQLNGKAAATILGRVKGLYGERFPTPAELVATDPERLRGAGLSRAKTAAVQDLAARTLEGVVPGVAELHALDDAEIVRRLTRVRGIGPWTVEMLLIFRLGRPDVWPTSDYGVRKGAARFLGRSELPTPRELGSLGEPWRPYRSLAAWYLWRCSELPEYEGP